MTSAQAWYDNSNMGERLPNIPEEVVAAAAEKQFDMKDCLDPQTAAEAMQAILDEQLSGYDGKPRRKPFRTRK